VTNDAEYAEASDKTKKIKEIKNHLEELKAEFVKPAKDIIEKARARYDEKIKRCEMIEKIIKDGAKKYYIQKEDERKKKEDEIAKKLEEGKIKTETAVRRIEKLPEVQKTVRTDESGLQVKKRRVPIIEDPSKIPHEFWEINEPMVRKAALARDKAGLPQIPGVIMKEEIDMASF
jgi:hypothetical protein